MAAFDEQEYTKSFDLKIWKRLTPLLAPYKMAFVGMFAFNALCALVDVVLPLFQRYAIGNVIEAGTLQGLVLWPVLPGSHSPPGTVCGGFQPELHAH